MKRLALCGIILFFASFIRAQSYYYVQSPFDTLTVIPSDYVAGYTLSADGAYVMLVTGKTLVIPGAERIEQECPVELPSFSSYRFRKKYNDQLFLGVSAQEEELLLDTVRLSVGQIGKYLTATFQFKDEDAVAWVGTVRQKSDVTRQCMSSPVTYTIGHKEWRQLQIMEDETDGLTYRYVPFGRQVTVCTRFLTDHPTNIYNVPLINITTATNSLPLSKTAYISGTITIDGGGVYPDMPQTNMLIKGRGNSSWQDNDSSKNSYHFKFAEKQKPLGMTGGKHWILLANKQEGSMLCNALEQKASALAGCASVCHIVPVELYINGQYRGSYNLTEKVGFHNNSVSLGDESCAAMLELDTYTDEPIWRDNAYNICTKIHDPDFDEGDSLLLITQQDVLNDWNEATQTLRYGGSEDYTRRFDVNSLASYLFANELCYNSEPQHPKSVFLYSENVLDDLQPWVFGPMWDCDWSFGYNIDSDDYFVNCIEEAYYDGWLGDELDGFWYDLRYKSQTVDKAYYTLWHRFMTDGRLQELLDYVKDYYNYAAPSLLHNRVNETIHRDDSNYAVIARRAVSWFQERANYVYRSLEAYEIEDDTEDEAPTPCIIDTEDSIETIHNSKFKIQNEVAIYDLSGRCISAEANSSLIYSEHSRTTLHSSFKKGLYIQGGKKIVIK